MKRSVLLCLLLMPALAWGQVTITGKLISAADKKPVPYASVFLSNTVVGAQTTEDGSFTLTNVKNGQYDLVISFIGFETHHQTVTVTGTSLTLGIITITPKATQLKEVTIGADPNRDRNLADFIREFIGHSENAADCKILNPEVINLRFDGRSLIASSDDYILIENKALGYKIRYQLNTFTRNYTTGMVFFAGPVLFEQLPGKPSQIRGWQKRRLDVYQGSDMHFFRSIFADQLAQEGFRVLRLIKKPNPERPSDSLIRAKLRLFALNARSHPGWKDSADYWNKKRQLPKILEYLVKQPRPLNDFVARTDIRTMLALKFTDYLYLIYTKKRSIENNSKVYHPVDMPDYPTTVIQLNTAFAVFDSNGIVVDPTSITFEGAWGLNRVADMLPIDYEPVADKK